MCGKQPREIWGKYWIFIFDLFSIVLARSLCYCFSFLMDHSASKGTESNQTLCMVHLLCIKCSKGLFGTVINTSTLIYLFSQGTCIYCLLSGSRVCSLCTRESREKVGFAPEFCWWNLLWWLVMTRVSYWWMRTNLTLTQCELFWDVAIFPLWMWFNPSYSENW